LLSKFIWLVSCDLSYIVILLFRKTSETFYYFYYIQLSLFSNKNARQKATEGFTRETERADKRQRTRRLHRRRVRTINDL